MMPSLLYLVAAIHTLGFSAPTPEFLSESKDTPAVSLSPGEMKVKVYRAEKKIYMDAVYLAEKISIEDIRSTAFDVSRYDEIQVPGVIQAEPVNDEVLWMHSETMSVHSKDYFLLTTFNDLDEAGARGFSWTPIKKEPKWQYKEKSKFNDFAGYFYSKSVTRENSQEPLVYIRYAMMFDVNSFLPSFMIKAVLDFKGEALARDYVLAVVKAASKKKDH